MKRYRNLLLLLVTGLAVAGAEGRIDRIIDADWKFTRENAIGAEAVAYSDRHWESLSLPHTWNARDGQDGGNDYYRGTAWYRKHLALVPAYAGKSVFLKFDGVATSAHVYVNGVLAGMHKGNFGAFCFDISSLVKFDVPNVIAVRVNNARDTTVAPLRGDFTIFGGIYRDVHVLVLEKLSISPLDYASSGVYVKQSRVNMEAADLEVTTVVRNASTEEKNATIRCSVSDRKGKVLKAIESTVVLAPVSQRNEIQNISLITPHLWNGRKDPYLYHVAVEVLEKRTLKDRVVQPLGLRFFNVDPEKGFFLNGQPYRLYGVNRHQDRENKGWAIGSKEHQEDYRLIEGMGCSAVRLAHYQHAQEFYDLCDRGGMVVWAELALVDEINPCVEFAAGCKEQLKELIKQNFNHPSIIFWSLFNELMPDANRGLYGEVVTDLNTLAKQIDPTRLTTMASRSRYDGSEYMNTVTDVMGYNVYRGWYEGAPKDFADYADTLHGRFPQHRICISEYGAGAGISQHEYPPRKPKTRGPWHPEEWQSVLHEVTWKAMAERPFLWGTFVWNMFDFASDGRSEGELHGRNDKGLVTYDRKVKKDAFFWYKANWNSEPIVYITSRRFSPRSGGITDIKIYSNCDSVQVYVNGISQGGRKSSDKIFLWNDVTLNLGKNSVRATGVKNGKRVEDTCEWIYSVDPEKSAPEKR